MQKNPKNKTKNKKQELRIILGTEITKILIYRMDLLKELSLRNLQKGNFDRFKFIVNNLLEYHACSYGRKIC